jgi:hypothetical protein
MLGAFGLRLGEWQPREAAGGGAAAAQRAWYARRPMGDGETRAEQRRRTWRGGVVSGFAEAEAMDLEFWLSATPGERIRAVAELALAMFPTEATGGSPPRLQRAVGGIRPLKR